MMVWLLMNICVTLPQWVNSLAPGRFRWNFRNIILKLILVIDDWIISCEMALRWMSLNLKAQSHLDVWRERVNTVWKSHQHVQNWTCAPVNHPPTCSKRVSNVWRPTAHHVETVLATFPKQFHTVYERVPACQTSIQRVLDVFVTCKYRAQRVRSGR